MAFTETDFEDILLYGSTHKFIVSGFTKEGVPRTFTGADLTVFKDRSDEHAKTYRVFDQLGYLVNYRDANGVVQKGTARKLLTEIDRERRLNGSGTVARASSIPGDINPTREALRGWMRGLRR